MNTIIFATNNQNKVSEVKSIVLGKFNIISLKEAGIDIDIAEPFDTLEENAKEKAKVIYELSRRDCFSEDTGLEVKSLAGEPGVKSARYAGEARSFENNIDKLLSKLANTTDRSARFRTVICLMWEGNTLFFEGICQGSILSERRGSSGFGYDPVFVPEGSVKSFAEMTMSEKNVFSHRRKAIELLTDYLISCS
ncbi:MAG TPA: RdgB/HAM1 family non-canonical purine NTP pyrophosphatase [Hanamia sp.]|nr:RdgB/HAM1 family non-canonical purine NTP pyrophosphatase [Hanamia sp.]